MMPRRFTFYQGDPNGFFIGELDGAAVAVGSAVIYDDQYAFCGLYIVSPEHRGKGYGLALTEARLAYCGDRNIGIDGVLENVDIYARIGYRKYYQNARYQFAAVDASKRHRCIRSIDEVAADVLNRYDRRCFPAARETFLNVWIHQEDALSLASLSNAALPGTTATTSSERFQYINDVIEDRTKDPTVTVLMKPLMPTNTTLPPARLTRRADTASKLIVSLGAKAAVKVDEVKGNTSYASAHDLRRAFGQRWARRVMPLVLKELMRHENVFTTEKYYVDIDSDGTAALLAGLSPENQGLGDTSVDTSQKQQSTKRAH